MFSLVRVACTLAPFRLVPADFFSDDATRPLNDPSPTSVQFDKFSIYALFNCINYIVGLHHANYIIRICYLLVSEPFALLLQRLFASLLYFLLFFFFFLFTFSFPLCEIKNKIKHKYN